MRYLLQTMFLVLALSCGAAFQSRAQSDVRVGYMAIAEELPKIVASEKGIFKSHGLNAELVRFESGPDMGTALLGGSIQFGMIGTPGLINAAIAGRPLVAIVDNGSNVEGPQNSEYYTGLVVLDSSPIRNIGDLKGKKIAVNVLKANSEVQTIMQVLRWNNEHPDQQIDLNKDVQFLTIPFGSMPTALEQGRADVASMIEPFTTQLKEKQKIRIIAPVSYALPNWPVSFGVVRRDYARANIDALKRYRDAWYEAVDWIGVHPDEARALLQKYAQVPADVAKKIVLPHWSKDIKQAETSTQRLMDGMVAGGMIREKYDLQKVIVDNLSTLQGPAQ